MRWTNLLSNHFTATMFLPTSQQKLKEPLPSYLSILALCRLQIGNLLLLAVSTESITNSLNLKSFLHCSLSNIYFKILDQITVSYMRKHFYTPLWGLFFIYCFREILPLKGIRLSSIEWCSSVSKWVNEL